MDFFATELSFIVLCIGCTEHEGEAMMYAQKKKYGQNLGFQLKLGFLVEYKR